MRNRSSSRSLSRSGRTSESSLSRFARERTPSTPMYGTPAAAATVRPATSSMRRGRFQFNGQHNCLGLSSLNRLDVMLHELLITRCAHLEVRERGHINRAKRRAGPGQFLRYGWGNNDSSEKLFQQCDLCEEMECADWGCAAYDNRHSPCLGSRILPLISSSCRKYSSSMR